MNYFENCTDEASYRARYRELAKKHHPDLGGDTCTMQDINSQFSECEKRGFKKDPYRTWTSTGKRHSQRGGRYNNRYTTGPFDFDFGDDAGEFYSRWSRFYAERTKPADQAYKMQEEMRRRAKEEKERQAKIRKDTFEKYIFELSNTYKERIQHCTQEQLMEECLKLYRNYMRVTKKDSFFK